jgi:hypothetical protein
MREKFERIRDLKLEIEDLERRIARAAPELADALAGLLRYPLREPFVLAWPGEWYPERPVKNALWILSEAECRAFLRKMRRRKLTAAQMAYGAEHVIECEGKNRTRYEV